jgi:hypothetical protein
MSDLTPQQQRIITLLAAGRSITQAASEEKIHRNTVGYWRRTIPAFARELEFALCEQRRYCHDRATELASHAFRAIEDALTNPKTSPSLRFRAATFVIKMAAQPELGSFVPAAQTTPEIPEPAQSCTTEPELASFIPTSEPPDSNENSGPASEGFDTSASRGNAKAAQSCTRAQPIRVAPQPGRNESCPCGSGIKFKRCCLGKPPLQAKAAA